MKKLLILAFVLTSAFASAQTDISTQGGALTSGFSNKSMTMTASPVVAAVIGGVFGPAIGSVSLQTPIVASGTLAAGATFGAGGSFIVQISSPSSVTYNGTFQSGAWSKVTLANGTHTYTLTGTLTDVVTGETATFVLQTSNIAGNFDTVISVSYVSILLN